MFHDAEVPASLKSYSLRFSSLLLAVQNNPEDEHFEEALEKQGLPWWSKEPHTQNTLLHSAVISGCVVVLRRLLQLPKLQDNIDALNALKMTPLHLALTHGQEAMCRVLLEHRAAPNPPSSAPPPSSYLYQALENKHLGIVGLLLQHGALFSLASTQELQPWVQVLGELPHHGVWEELHDHQIPTLLQQRLDAFAQFDLKASGMRLPPELSVLAVLCGATQCLAWIMERHDPWAQPFFTQSNRSPYTTALSLGDYPLAAFLLKDALSARGKRHYMMRSAENGGHLLEQTLRSLPEEGLAPFLAAIGKQALQQLRALWNEKSVTEPHKKHYPDALARRLNKEALLPLCEPPFFDEDQQMIPDLVLQVLSFLKKKHRDSYLFNPNYSNSLPEQPPSFFYQSYFRILQPYLQQLMERSLHNHHGLVHLDSFQKIWILMNALIEKWNQVAQKIGIDEEPPQPAGTEDESAFLETLHLPDSLMSDVKEWPCFEAFETDEYGFFTLPLLSSDHNTLCTTSSFHSVLTIFVFMNELKKNLKDMSFSSSCLQKPVVHEALLGLAHAFVAHMNTSTKVGHNPVVRPFSAPSCAHHAFLGQQLAQWDLQPSQSPAPECSVLFSPQAVTYSLALQNKIKDFLETPNVAQHPLLANSERSLIEPMLVFLKKIKHKINPQFLTSTNKPYALLLNHLLSRAHQEPTCLAWPASCSPQADQDRDPSSSSPHALRRRKRARTQHQPPC